MYNMQPLSNILKALRAIALLVVVLPAESVGNDDHRASCSILVVGDSISSGYGLLEHEVWVERFKVVAQKILTADIVNRSKSGLTIDQAIQLVEEASVSSYVATILQVGSNDGLFGRSVDDIRASFEKLLDRLEHTEVFLIEGTVPADYDSDYRQRLAEVYEAIAKDKKVMLIEIPFEQYLHNSEYLQEDRIHPNVRGQSVILNAVVGAFKDSGIGKRNNC